MLFRFLALCTVIQCFRFTFFAPGQRDLPPLLSTLQAGLQYHVSDWQYMLQEALQQLDFSRDEFRESCDKARSVVIDSLVPLSYLKLHCLS